jgi:hypothetical protein
MNFGSNNTANSTSTFSNANNSNTAQNSSFPSNSSSIGGESVEMSFQTGNARAISIPRRRRKL